jgi:peptidoglycan/LPS O-acetylase OafA/YrhL
MKGYLPTLDGWRALAILGVLIYHGCTYLFCSVGPYPSYQASLLIQAGARGVDIFFAISGFLICSRLLQEQREQGRIHLKGFYIRRFFRILPPYFMYLAVLALLVPAGIVSIRANEWWGCVLFVRNYVAGGWYTAHFWSLSIEEHFYLFLPALLLLAGVRQARPVVLVLALLIAVWRHLDGHFHWLAALGAVDLRTDTRLDALLWGCWTALLMSIPAYRECVRKWFSLGLWLGVVGILLALARYRPSWDQTLQAFLMPWLLLGTVLRPTGLVAQVLESRLLRWIGRLSYSLYIWQQLFLFGIGHWNSPRPFPLGPLQELPGSICATFACATASYYLVERPAIRLGQRLATWRQQPPPCREEIIPQPVQSGAVAAQ